MFNTASSMKLARLCVPSLFVLAMAGCTQLEPKPIGPTQNAPAKKAPDDGSRSYSREYTYHINDQDGTPMTVLLSEAVTIDKDGHTKALSMTMDAHDQNGDRRFFGMETAKNQAIVSTSAEWNYILSHIYLPASSTCDTAASESCYSWPALGIQDFGIRPESP